MIGFAVFLVGGIAHAGDALRDVEQRGGEFAGNEVGFVAAGEREQHIGVGRACLFQQNGRGGVAHQRLHIKAAGDVFQGLFIGVHNGYIVAGHGGEFFGDGGADLSAA